jgi:AcrR family transcriptional regulator
MTRAESQAQTRAELLAAAARAFEQRGYSGASITEIAEAAGFTHGAVYSNFESKEDLFLALYEQWVAERVSEIEHSWPAEGTLADRARAVADDWIEHFRRDPRAFLLRLEFAVRGAHDSQLRRKLGTRVGAVPLAIRRLLDDSLGLGDDEAANTGALAIGLQALSIGMALELLSNPKAVPPGLAGDLAARLVGSFASRESARP